MDEKKYPIPEEEGNVGMASEPVAEYKATGSGYMNTMEDEPDDECMALSLDKESYTPEELREMLVNDVKEMYGVKDAI